MNSLNGSGCAIPAMYWLSRLASPSLALSGGCGSAVAPSCGLTRTTEKLMKELTRSFVRLAPTHFWGAIWKYCSKRNKSEKLALSLRKEPKPILLPERGSALYPLMSYSIFKQAGPNAAIVSFSYTILPEHAAGSWRFGRDLPFDLLRFSKGLGLRARLPLIAFVLPKKVVGETRSMCAATLSGIEYWVVRSLVDPVESTKLWKVVPRREFAVETDVWNQMLSPCVWYFVTPEASSQDLTASTVSLLGPKMAFTSSRSRYCPYDADPGVETDASLDSSWSVFCCVRAICRTICESLLGVFAKVHPLGTLASFSTRTAADAWRLKSSAKPVSLRARGKLILTSEIQNRRIA